MSEEGGPSEVFVDAGVGKGKHLRIEGVVDGQEFMKTSLSSFEIVMFRELCRLRDNCRMRFIEHDFIAGQLVAGICEVRLEEVVTIVGLANQIDEFLDLVLSIGKFAFETPSFELGGAVESFQFVVSGGRNSSGDKLAVLLCSVREQMFAVSETGGNVLIGGFFGFDSVFELSYPLVALSQVITGSKMFA